MEGPVAELPVSRSNRPRRKTKVEFTVPQIISHYSVYDGPDGKSVHQDQSRFLRVIHLPRNPNRTNFNLASGYIPFREGGTIICGGREPRLNMLLEHLCRAKDHINFQKDAQESRPIPFDFVTYRGILIRMMTLPYEERNDLLLSAQKYKGTIYIAKFASLAQRQHESEMTDRQNMFAYGGMKFEQCITIPLPRHRGKEQRKGFEYHDHFSCVITSKLGSHKLLYAGEMDAISSDKKYPHFEPSDFLEIKTTSAIRDDRNVEYLHKNMKYWWAQCYLSGIPALVCGFRNQQLIVNQIRRFSTQQLLENGRSYWSKDLCLEYLDAFLNFIKETMKDVDDPNIIYEFYWSPGDECVNCYINSNPVGLDDHKILFDWFTEHF